MGGWVFKRIARICDRLDLNPVIWKSELSDCVKLTHSPPTLPSLPVSLSSLPLFFFHVRSDIQLDDSFKQNGQNQPTNNSRAAGTLLYLLTYLTSLPTELLTKPDWQWCVCLCVCVFFFVFLSLSLSISNHFSWRVCNLMTFSFFFWVFSSVFPQN